MTTTGTLAQELITDPVPACGCSLSEVLGEFTNRIENNQPIIETLPCGWALLDETVGGLVRGEFCGVIGTPGTGKSTLCDLLVVQTLQRNPEAKAIIFAIETAMIVRAARLVASLSVEFSDRLDENDNPKVAACSPIGAMLRGTITQKDHALETARRMIAAFGDRLRFIDDVYDASTIAAIIDAERADVVLIDHLGLVVSESSSASEVNRFDESIGRIAAALRRVNSAGIIINECGKAALGAGRIGLAASRGSARFGSLAAMFVGLDQLPPEEGEKDPVVVALLDKNRFGLKNQQQPARFMGGLSYFNWGKVEPVRQEKK